MHKRRKQQLFPLTVFLMILLFASIPLKNVMASNTSVSKVLINKDRQYLEFILQGKNVKFEGNKIIMGVGDTLEIIAYDSFSHPQYSRELLFSETDHIEWLLKQPYINAYSHDYLQNFPRGDTYDPYLFFDAYDRSSLDSYGTYTARKEGKYEVAISYGFIVNIAQKRTNHYYQEFELIITDQPFSETTAAPKPQSPTLSNFNISPNVVEKGEHLSISGKINGNGNKIIAVSVGVRNVDNEELGGYWGHEKSLNVDTFDLTSFGKLKAGDKIGNTVLKPDEYIVQVYVTTDTGLSFEKEQKTTITIKEKATEYPTLINFKVSPSIAEEGERFSISGRINGNGNKITAVSVGVRNADNEELGGYWGEKKNISKSSFDLSSFGKLKVGDKIGNTTLSAGDYIVQVYVTTDSGLSFEKEQTATITIEEKDPVVIGAPKWQDEKKEITSAEDDVYLYYSVDDSAEYVLLEYEGCDKNGEVFEKASLGAYPVKKRFGYVLPQYKDYPYGFNDEPFSQFTAPISKLYLTVCDENEKPLSETSSPLFIHRTDLLIDSELSTPEWLEASHDIYSINDPIEMIFQAGEKTEYISLLYEEYDETGTLINSEWDSKKYPAYRLDAQTFTLGEPFTGFAAATTKVYMMACDASGNRLSANSAPMTVSLKEHVSDGSYNELLTGSSVTVASLENVGIGANNMNMIDYIAISYTDDYGNLQFVYPKIPNDSINLISFRDTIKIDINAFGADKKLSVHKGHNNMLDEGDLFWDWSGDMTGSGIGTDFNLVLNSIKNLQKDYSSTATVKLCRVVEKGPWPFGKNETLAQFKLNVSRNFEKRFGLWANNVQRNGATATTKVDVNSGESTVQFFAYDVAEKMHCRVGVQPFTSATQVAKELVLWLNGKELSHLTSYRTATTDGHYDTLTLTKGEYKIELKYRGITVDEVVLTVVDDLHMVNKAFGKDNAGLEFEITKSSVWISDNYEYIRDYNDPFWIKALGGDRTLSGIDKTLIAGEGIAPSHILLLTSEDALTFVNQLKAISSEKAESAAMTYFVEKLPGALLNVGDKALKLNMDGIYQAIAEDTIVNTIPDYEKNEISDLTMSYMIGVLKAKIPPVALIMEAKDLGGLISEVYLSDGMRKMAERISEHAENGYGVSIVWGYDTGSKTHVCKIYGSVGYYSAYKEWNRKYDFNEGKYVYTYTTPTNSDESHLKGYIVLDQGFVNRVIEEAYDYFLD